MMLCEKKKDIPVGNLLLQKLYTHEQRQFDERCLELDMYPDDVFSLFPPLARKVVGVHKNGDHLIRTVGNGMLRLSPLVGSVFAFWFGEQSAFSYVILHAGESFSPFFRSSKIIRAYSIDFDYITMDCAWSQHR